MSGTEAPERAGEPGILADEIVSAPVTHSRTAFEGHVWDVVRERVDLGEAGEVERDWVRHPGAVGVLALDDQDRVALVHQYRHPVGMRLWELPAGLLDVPGEPPVEAARRELAEEADLRAGEWYTLVDWMASPGGMSEALRCFLARDLSPVPEAERHQRDAEELGMPMAWWPLDEVHDAILAGRLHNPALIIAVLTAVASRDRGWSTLRPADDPWPEHPSYR